VTPLSVALILVSALLHSSWNYYSKRGNWPFEFFFWVFLWGALLYLPFFFVFTPFPAPFIELSPKIWGLATFSGLLQIPYLMSLIEAYRLGDLSLVYPISRSAPLFTLIWASVFIGESLSLQGVFGIGLVTTGVFVVSFGDFRLAGASRQPGRRDFRPCLLALFAALAGSVYSVVDKVVVQSLPPVYYIWYIDVSMCAGMGGYLFFRGETSFRETWRGSKKEIFAIALLQNIGYGCFLLALQLSRVSYVVAFRQVSVLFGAGLGLVLLKERHGPTRIAGAAILTAGLFLIALSK
jgi:drug/metabolite transporter (DMT)-like permease